ncbi:MAG: hypothetical protein PSV35_08315, partial [bacterium]|nr:hypothetical protein [bacterium]
MITKKTVFFKSFPLSSLTKFIITSSFIVSPSLVIATHSNFVDKLWIGDVGDWNTVGNWSPLGVPTSQDVITISGSNSQVTNSNIALDIGNGGIGSLNLKNAAKLNTSNFDVNIGKGATGNGSVTVDGAGSMWTNNTRLLVGVNGGTGTLNITNGGEVTNNSIILAIGISGVGSLNL